MNVVESLCPDRREEEVICKCLFCSVGVCVMWWASVQHLLWDCKCEEMGFIFLFLWAWPLREPVVLKRVIPEYTNPWQPLVLVDQRLCSSVRFLFCWAHCYVDGTCSCPLTKLSVIFFWGFFFVTDLLKFFKRQDYQRNHKGVLSTRLKKENFLWENGSYLLKGEQPFFNGSPWHLEVKFHLRTCCPIRIVNFHQVFTL
jgi:hypothetical protein